MKLKRKSFVIHPDIVFREEEEGAFLFNPQIDVLRCINKVGASICRQCNGKNDMDNICRGILEEYDVDVTPAMLKEDVKTFIDRLIDLNLIKEQ